MNAQKSRLHAGRRLFLWSEMTEADAIVLLIVATGYLLAITKKK